MIIGQQVSGGMESGLTAVSDSSREDSTRQLLKALSVQAHRLMLLEKSMESLLNRLLPLIPPGKLEEGKKGMVSYVEEANEMPKSEIVLQVENTTQRVSSLIVAVTAIDHSLDI